MVALALLVGLAAGIPLGGHLMPASQGAATGPAFSAVPQAIGAEDVSGPYEVVPDWPLESLSIRPGNSQP
jgi:hypothetical protein